MCISRSRREVAIKEHWEPSNVLWEEQKNTPSSSCGNETSNGYTLGAALAGRTCDWVCSCGNETSNGFTLGAALTGRTCDWVCGQLNCEWRIQLFIEGNVFPQSSQLKGMSSAVSGTSISSMYRGDVQSCSNRREAFWYARCTDESQISRRYRLTCNFHAGKDTDVVLRSCVLRARFAT